MLSTCLAFSLHLMQGDFNAVHPCIRYEHGGWAVGAFLNSEWRLSLVAGHEWQSGPWWIEAGIATGYSAPIVPVLRGGYDLGTARLFVAPAATADLEPGLVLGVEFTFGD